MSHQVTIEPAGKRFAVEDDETLLDAALRQHVNLPYGCRNGACGSCKGRVVSGEFTLGKFSPSALSAQERAEGKALFCCATAASDLTIECREVQGAGDIVVRKMPCRVQALDRLAPDVMRIALQLPANERLQYLAGQYIEFILKDGSRRAYSIATPPQAEGGIELHVRHMPGGLFTDLVFGAREPALRVRDILRFEGPLGSFFLREDSARPIVMLASGTGFAPIKAMIEQAAAEGVTRPIHLYWGGRRPQDIYARAQCEAWAADAGRALRFVPVVSDALPGDAWAGRTGLVHEAVLADLPDLSGFEVYACGAPVMVEAARRDFSARAGLPAEQFFADAFTSARDLAEA